MDYTAINTKIRAMHGHIFKQADYETMVKLPNVAEIGHYLKADSVYKKTLETLSEENNNRVFLEQKIILSLHDEFLRLAKFTTDIDDRRFLDAYFLRNEISTIKLLLGSIYDERDVTYSIKELNETLLKRLKIDTTKVKNFKTVNEFVLFLESTPFNKVISNVYNENTTLFQLEMQLDLYYFSNLIQACNKHLRGKDQKLALEFVQMEIDIQNIDWIYRLKKFYNMPSNSIYTMLIPNDNKISRKQTAKMVEAKTIEQLQEEIDKTEYKEAFGDFQNIENVLVNELLKFLNAATKDNENTIMTTLSYIFDKQMEVKNLTSVVEGVKYGLTAKDILKHIFCGLEKGVGS